MTTRLIPREVLFGNPEKASPAISPDGRRVAWLAPVDGVLNVWVGHLGAGDAAPVTGDRERGVRDYRWAHDDRHLLYVQDRGGDEDWHLYAVDLDGGETRDLTPFDGVQAQLVADGKRFPGRVLVGLNRDNPELHDVYRVELGSMPVGFSRDGSSLLLVSSQGANAARLVRLDLASGDRKVLFEDPRYDVQTVVLHPDT